MFWMLALVWNPEIAIPLLVVLLIVVVPIWSLRKIQRHNGIRGDKSSSRHEPYLGSARPADELNNQAKTLGPSEQAAHAFFSDLFDAVSKVAANSSRLVGSQPSSAEIDQELNKTCQAVAERHYPSQANDGYLRNLITMAEAEAKYAFIIGGPGDPPVAFGYMNHRWCELLALIRDGDELWEYRSDQESWGHLAGREGIVLIRDGKWIFDICTAMN